MRRAAALGFVTGVVYFTGTLYWITRVMAVYGNLQTWVALLVNAALILYLSLFPAVFAAIVARLIARFGSIALLGAPIVWVATELGRTYLLTGFPWVLLGYSQATVLPIAQLASVTGVYGVSMLVALVSATLAMIAAQGPREGDRHGPPEGGRYDLQGPAEAGHYVRLVPAAVAIALVLLVAVWGSRRVAASAWTRDGDAIRVGLVQGNVDQGIKWDPTRATTIFQEHVNRTREAIGRGASLVLWPESSTPFLFEEEPVGAELLRRLARQARATLLFGSDQIEWSTVNHQRVPAKYFNAAYLIRPDGSTAGTYRKMHLVPFGEYVPLQRLLFFAAPLTEQVGTFTPGMRPELLPVDGHPVSVAICYEVVYPALVRQFVQAGSELLTTITNDAWFGATAAPYQHFEQASMRAIEEGRYLVRAANTGISGIVDPYGRVIEKTEIFQPAVLVGEVRFLRTSTFYARHGDVVAYLSLGITVGLLIVPRRRVQ